MSMLGLQVETFPSQTLCLAPLAIIHLLSPPVLPLLSLLFFLQRIDNGLSVCAPHSFPP